jgi:hypothetical protein
MANKKHSTESYSDSEDEYIKSWVGNVPEKWYDNEEHFGYDEKGNKVANNTESVINKLLK